MSWRSWDGPTGVLALAPAGLWRRHSPLLTDINLNVNWRLGRLAGPLALRALARRRFARYRCAASAQAARCSSGRGIETARAAIASDSFPRHFSETRRLRFRDGQAIDVPVKVIWGERDHVALPEQIAQYRGAAPPC